MKNSNCGNCPHIHRCYATNDDECIDTIIGKKNYISDRDKQIRADAIDECFEKIEQRLNDDTEISFDLPVEEVLGNDVDVNGFLMLAEEIVQKYKGLIFSKLKEAKYQLKEQKNEP